MTETLEQLWRIQRLLTEAVEIERGKPGVGMRSQSFRMATTKLDLLIKALTPPREADVVRRFEQLFEDGPADDPLTTLDFARALYREFHGLCFWHCPRDLEITHANLHIVLKGLRTYGGHRGFQLAGKLRDRMMSDEPEEPK